MSEEEQLEAAMKLSMQDTGPVQQGFASATRPAPKVAPLPPPARGKPRSFPGKDPGDSFTLPPRSSAKKKRGEPRAELAGAEVKLDDAATADLLRLLFGDKPEAADVERWLNIGFEFSPLAGTEWGLRQRQGGPCGIFAPVQAFIVKHLLFSGASGEGVEPDIATRRKDHPLAIAGTDEDGARDSTLAYALATVLFHATPKSSYFVCEVTPLIVAQATPAAALETMADAASSAAAVALGLGGVKVSGRRVARVSDAQQLLEEGVDTWLAGPCGVLSFVCSVLLSRTLDAVREDMDDPCNPLIGRFGHCSQELVNLMLLGEATSNVFDGTRWLGDDPSSGFLVKGVDSDRIGVPPVGFLSELEPMRYLCVGTLYKHPEYPIWVLGSPTHYTLIFSARRSDSQLSDEAQLEQRAKKVFVDNAFDEGGLAMASNLCKMLEALGIGQDRLSQAQNDLVREDIILWEDFRSWTCKQFGLGDSGPVRLEGSNKLTLFLYDGQDPPGPSLRSVALELSDIDPLLAGGGSEGDAFAATLHTRWPNAAVQVHPLAGAGAEGVGASL